MPVEPTLSGLDAGKTGDAHRLFMERGVVAIGWVAMGDLCALPASPEAFKVRVAETYPHMKEGAIPTNARQLFRFVHEMRVGDLVAYPSKVDKEIHLGRLASDYRYEPDGEASYPHRRTVEWLKSVPRTSFSQGALYEIGSAMSLFQGKNYADEYLTILGGQASVDVAEGDDETVSVVADEIEQTTRDFVLKKLGRDLKGHPFAEFVGHLLTRMGYRVKVSLPGPDHGIDVLAHRDELGFEPPIIKVQVKSGAGSAGEPEVAQLYGKVGYQEYGLFVTLGTFTSSAKTFAQNQTNLRLIDQNELVELFLRHYESLDPKYKGAIPLQRIYVPEVIEE